MTALRDIRDVEGYVGKLVLRQFPAALGDEHDELVAEGVALVYELEAGFEEHREGYAQAGSFAGYVSRLLPLRLRDAWRALHPAAAASVAAPMSLDADAGQAQQLRATMVMGPDCFAAGSAAAAPFDLGSPAVRVGKAMLEAQIRSEASSLPTSSVQSRAEKRLRLYLHQQAGRSAEEAGAAEGLGRTQAYAALRQMERALESQDYVEVMRELRLETARAEAWLEAARDEWQQVVADGVPR